MRGWAGAAPVAASSSVSLVEVSPSTVMQLKERSEASRSSARSTGAGSLASVATKASMVAMSGAIMPDPLAMPLIWTVTPPIRACRVASLGKVSVVMMAAAAAAQPSSANAAVRSGRPAVMRSSASGSPMTPVEARKTSSRAQPSAEAAAAAQRRTEASPSRPVKALALPELTRIARARPPFSAARHQSTGAEAVSERVSTPAMVVPGVNSIRQTSVRP